MNDVILDFQRLIFAICIGTPRLVVAFTITPFFNSRMITGMTRNTIAVSFALILFPVILPELSENKLSIVNFMGIMVKESVIGAAIGFVMGLFFWGVESMGSILDFQRGAGMARAFDPATAAETSPLKNFLLQVAIALFFMSGGFTLFLSSVYESYTVWPIYSYLPEINSNFAEFFLKKVDDLMTMVVLLTAPVMIAMFLSEFGLALINRFSPQLNVFFLSLPIKSAVAVFMLILYMQYLLPYLKKYMFQDAAVLDTLKMIIK
jgi:type III secretion protein T